MNLNEFAVVVCLISFVCMIVTTWSLASISYSSRRVTHELKMFREQIEKVQSRNNISRVPTPTPPPPIPVGQLVDSWLR